MERPPTSADRSRPPTPRQCRTPTPAPSSKESRCCAPVPDAATIPTGPGRTTFEKPRPTPSTTAVPQSGPMTSRPASPAHVLSATSWSTLTLSLNTITSSPAARASAASMAATRPGVLTRARVASTLRAAVPTVGAGGTPSPSPLDAPGRRARISSRAAVAVATASSVSVSIATTMSLGDASAGTSKPSCTSRSRLSSVAIATCTVTTSSRPLSSRLTCISVTESW